MALLRLSVVAALLQGAVAFAPSSLRRSVAPRVAKTTAPRMGAMDVKFDPSKLEGENCRIGIITTRWNPEIISSLQTGCKDTLKDLGVKEENIFETEVPGAFELPLAARFLALSGTVDAIVCVGCLIKGDTQHFEYISQATSSGLMSVGIQTSTPVVYGVLNVNTEQQALDRATGPDNHGISWAQTAVEMALLRSAALGMSKKTGMGFSDAAKLGGDGEKKEGGGFGF
uniref:6,7-dimethyl-8-ribityllumazine synthase n=1 Tax=Florenciella parvula TaxID=236787 RepID=A0A7S2BJM5_9STRA|mmetsp:Transcript_38104/g.87883  ORF Transcript_38104/g.87883 Transcript_38104/m.87883 type:complete len:228 (-) Transcript_38104:298-981(-)|eukprot:CAMPEP_0119473680 /NCGR_PEP_ID=MMETSP1344-20130328/5239_1 /TAXON_ID=236787 /ORGANISM="Florenciella parvula, Strain CCMP2471" /LENGTH=227 /DNA_ID=CAMNT_0007506841 /DNA_START=64 /DNA_END=747 /DNA_ORIENTATION=+